MLYLQAFMGYLSRQVQSLLWLGDAHGGGDLLPFKVLGATIYMAVNMMSWDALRSQFAEYFLFGPIMVVGGLWALDMGCGIALALRKDPKTGRRKWSPTRSAWGVAKLILWLVALLVAFLLRIDGNNLDDWLPPLIEVAVILTEASSVLRNLAELQEVVTGRPNAVLRLFAERADSQVADLAKRMDTTEQRQAAHSQEIANALEKVEAVQSVAAQAPPLSPLPPVVIVERVEALVTGMSAKEGPSPGAEGHSEENPSPTEAPPSAGPGSFDGAATTDPG